MTIPAGTRLGAFEVSSLLGVGGVGEVYLTRGGKLGREVTLKLLASDGCGPYVWSSPVSKGPSWPDPARVTAASVGWAFEPPSRFRVSAMPATS